MIDARKFHKTAAPFVKQLRLFWASVLHISKSVQCASEARSVQYVSGLEHKRTVSVRITYNVTLRGVHAAAVVEKQ